MVNVDGKQVVFRFFRPDAAQVCLVGEFNDWRDGELRMTLDDEGYWRAVIDLPPGDFRFRYVADGRPFTDYAAFGVEPGPFGYDSVVHVAGIPAGRARHCQSCTRAFTFDRRSVARAS